MRYLKYTIHASIVLSTLVMCGCDTSTTRGLLYLFGPTVKKTVKAEYSGLEGHSVAVLVYTGPGIVCDYPKAQDELSVAIARELRNRLRDVSIIPPNTVMSYQHNNPDWREEDVAKIARELKTDYVLMVTVAEYTSRALVSRAIQGRIRADAQLHEILQDADGVDFSDRVAWQCEEEIESLYPEKGEVYDRVFETRFLYEARRQFADKLVKHFRNYEVRTDDQI